MRPLPAVVGPELLFAEVGPGFALEDLIETRGVRGWPVSLVRGAQDYERRCVAIYRLLDRFATVLLIGEGDDDLILAGDLEWSGPPASLAAILGVGR